jgi:hypothetical protein
MSLDKFLDDNSQEVSGLILFTWTNTQSTGHRSGPLKMLWEMAGAVICASVDGKIKELTITSSFEFRNG